MRKEDIDDELLRASFDFFYWFSRFEFALKEHGYLKWNKPGAPAVPSWREFQRKHGDTYVPSPAARELLKLHPKQQVVGTGDLDWIPVDVSKCSTELCKLVLMLTTVRNNLFHGGKHGDKDMENKSKNL